MGNKKREKETKMDTTRPCREDHLVTDYLRTSRL